MTDGTIAGLMARYGQSVEVGRAGAFSPARAFLQPITRESGQQALPTPLGLRREDRFLYLGESGTALRAGQDRVRWQEQEFLVLTAHPIYMGKSLSHWWAVLVPADKEGA